MHDLYIYYVRIIILCFILTCTYKAVRYYAVGTPKTVVVQ